VRTLSISGGGPLGTGGAGVVVVVSLGVVVAGGAESLGRARNVSARAYGALKAIVSESSAAVLVWRACDPSAPESGRRPGVDIGPVLRPVGTTRRPAGGANDSAGARFGVADAADTALGSDPGSAIRKPIVAPATTASSSQQTVRRGTK
jgi:hypothetical protein